MIKTPDLINALAANVTPVRRLRPPAMRAVGWLLLAAGQRLNGASALARHGNWLLGLVLVVSTASAAIAASQAPPVFRSATSQFTLLTPIDPAPNPPIQGLDGTMNHLRRFRGRVVVLNFWATWCLPCAYEMPSLDRLAATSESRNLAVVAVSIDKDGAAAVGPFIASHHLRHLAIYLDPDRRLGSLDVDRTGAGVLPLWGLPITYILDRDGRVLGYLTGAANWDSPAASRFLGYFARATTPNTKTL